MARTFSANLEASQDWSASSSSLRFKGGRKRNTISRLCRDNSGPSDASAIPKWVGLVSVLAAIGLLMGPPSSGTLTPAVAQR